MMADVRDFHSAIVQAVKNPDVVSHLVSAGVISPEDGDRIKGWYISNDILRASEEMLQCFYKSKLPKKTECLLLAFKETGYSFLKNLIEGTDYEDISHLHAKKIIQIFAPVLEKQLNCGDIISDLYSRNVIGEPDREIIMSTLHQKGNMCAMMVLLERMKCRLSPQQWYFDFLDVLMERSYEPLVKEIEPDFIQNRSSYLPQLGPIYTDSGVKSPNKATVHLSEGGAERSGAYGSTHEHLLEDYGEGQTVSNDLGAPPAPPERSDSLALSRSDSRTESLTNIKELNIKPELTIKDLTIADDETEDIGNESGGTDEQNEEEDESTDENSLASSYESGDEDISPKIELRKYQLELAENAVRGGNTIICAETGSGKTWVALHIIKEHLNEASNVRKKVVFMARTGALIKQQFDRFQKYLPNFTSKLITGEDDESRMLNMFVEGDYDILCFTPQILVNNLDDKVIKSLSVFSLLFLDECHHTRGDEPYNRLMRRYLIEKANKVKDLPQVVGLTASVGIGKSRTEAEAIDYILRVMACLDVEIISSVERNIAELQKHTNHPEEETIPLRKLFPDPCKDIIIGAMEDTEDMLKENAFMQPDLIELVTDKHPRNKESQEYNKWTVDVMKQAELKVDNHDISRDISTCAKYLNIYNSALEINKLLTTQDVIRFLAEKHRLESEHKDKLTTMERKLFDNLMAVQKKLSTKGRNIENPNVRIVSNTLRTMLDQKGEESRAMVFVKARATCKSLAAFLDKDLEQIAVKASPLYGKENRGGDEGMSESVQTEILDKFRSGFFKILVCTSVGNEGIDVPDCNIVLSYEYSADEVTKIQMKGRARKHGATAVVMGSENVVDQDRMNAFKASLMYKALAKVKVLEPKVVHRKVAMFQQEETNKHRWKVEVEEMKKGRKSEEDYEILCRRCNTVACFASDVRQMGHDHIVIDKVFKNKITRKPHNRPKTYDGITKKFKMYCKKCPIDWGIIGTRDGLECMILKIQSFKFRNLRTKGVETYKKWIDFPYKVPGITLEDLPRLLDEPVEENVDE